jgi:hypothetical protein
MLVKKIKMKKSRKPALFLSPWYLTHYILLMFIELNVSKIGQIRQK